MLQEFFTTEAHIMPVKRVLKRRGTRSSAGLTVKDKKPKCEYMYSWNLLQFY
jgi:hypothetical protein